MVMILWWMLIQHYPNILVCVRTRECMCECECVWACVLSRSVVSNSLRPHEL